MFWISILLASVCIGLEGSACAETSKDGKPGTKKEGQIMALPGMDSEQFSKLPTFIKSDTLTLQSQRRTFTYSGHVEISQGDMILTSNFMDGKYTEDNKIEQLVARDNVVITKGPTIRATGQKAVYDAANSVVTLTDNPELQQDGSVLSADVIKIFLNENRSQAEGTVRVKLQQKKGTQVNLKDLAASKND